MSRLTVAARLAALSLAATTTAAAQGVQWEGLDHFPIGGAQVAVQPGNHLVVSNIGSSGQDGVRIALPPQSGNIVHSLFLDPMDPAGNVTPGGFVETVYRGELGGQPDRVLSTARKTRAQSGELRLETDYSPIGALGSRIFVHNNGVLVADVTLPGPLALVDVDIDNTICEVWCEGWGDWEFTLSDEVAINVPNGTTVIGNEIGVFPVGNTTPMSVSAAEIRAAGIPHLRFVGESLAVGTIGEQYCSANPNSTGNYATLLGAGSLLAADNDVTLNAFDLPPNAFGFFIVSQTQGFIAHAGNSAGNLCVLGQIGRYVAPGQIQDSGAAGQFSLRIDTTAMPRPTTTVPAQAGERWYFQAWFRDTSPVGPTSNFSRGLCIGFQ